MKNELAGFLRGNGIKISDIAVLLDKTVPTISRKVNKKSSFQQKEIKLLHDQYNIPYDMFFNKNEE